MKHGEPGDCMGLHGKTVAKGGGAPCQAGPRHLPTERAPTHTAWCVHLPHWPCPPPPGKSTSRTCRSSEHVIHQGPKAPPIHSTVMPAPHQDLWSPRDGQIYPEPLRVRTGADLWEEAAGEAGGLEHGSLSPTCTQWCHRKYG